MDSSANFFRGMKILVAGGSGTIGVPVVTKLLAAGAYVTVVSKDNVSYVKRVLPSEIIFKKSDLTNFKNCLEATRKKDFVINLLGIKGSVGIGESKAASYFMETLRFQTNLMEAAFRSGVSRYLFVSSICVYPQSDRPRNEEDAWKGLPKQSDRYSGIAKRVGEIQGETYLAQYSWDAVRIVRPANVYGPFDDFDPRTAQVIPALVARAANGKNPLVVWGDGSAIRDFIYSDDAADGILLSLEKAPSCVPINLGSGRKVTIRKIANIVAGLVPHRPKIKWDTTKPTGDKIRILDVSRARKMLGFTATMKLEDGILKTFNWYIKNKKLAKTKKSGLALI